MNIGAAVSFIGVITFALSMVGVKVGSLFGAKYKSKAELAGGIISILMGLKILLEHLGVLGCTQCLGSQFAPGGGGVNAAPVQKGSARARGLHPGNSRRVAARDNSRLGQLASLVLIEPLAHVRAVGG